MKVSELIEQLKRQDPDLPVYFSYPYGDRCDSQVASTADEIDQIDLVYSDYHNSMKVPPEDEETCEDEDEDKKTITAIVIS